MESVDVINLLFYSVHFLKKFQYCAVKTVLFYLLWICLVDGYEITCLKGMDLKCTGMIDNVDRHRLTLLKGLDLYIDGHGLTLFINVDSED